MVLLQVKMMLKNKLQSFLGMKRRRIQKQIHSDKAAEEAFN